MSHPSEVPALPPLSAQPSRAEIAALISTIKHDLVGFMQAVKVGLELLAREELDRDTEQEVMALIQETVERGFAYGRMLEDMARQLEIP